MIYKIKMSALDKEIEIVRQKLNKLTNDPMKRFWNLYIYNINKKIQLIMFSLTNAEKIL